MDARGRPHDPSAYALPHPRRRSRRRCSDALGHRPRTRHRLLVGCPARLRDRRVRADRVRAFVLVRQPAVPDGTSRRQWRRRSPLRPRRATRSGMQGFVETFEARCSAFDSRSPSRSLELQNDPQAIRAAWASVFAEGAIADGLSDWRVPCLIYVGEDDEMHDCGAPGRRGDPDGEVPLVARPPHFSSEGEIDRRPRSDPRGPADRTDPVRSAGAWIFVSRSARRDVVRPATCLEERLELCRCPGAFSVSPSCRDFGPRRPGARPRRVEEDRASPASRREYSSDRMAAALRERRRRCGRRRGRGTRRQHLGGLRWLPRDVVRSPSVDGLEPDRRCAERAVERDPDAFWAVGHGALTRRPG